MSERTDTDRENAGVTDSTRAAPANQTSPVREIDYQHSGQFVPILKHLGCSLLVSTYAAGKLACVGVRDDELQLSFSNFQQAMGVAVGPRGIAVGATNMIWLLDDAKSLASRIEPPGTHDGGYVARESFVTGNIHVHEMGWDDNGQLWIVNTRFSCLCTLHEDYNFVPRWSPPFISDLEPQDRCHLNGLCFVSGKPKYVTALGKSDEPRGWRESKSSGGLVIDVETGQTVADGFCMPHSPRVHQDKLYVLDSGRGQLVTIDQSSGDKQVVCDYPGYGRGLAFHGQFAFIGMSKARETSVFGGVPICADRTTMRCGIVAVDLMSRRAVAFLEFQTGVDELFDVQIISGTRNPVVSGPYPTLDRQAPIWVVPPPDRAGQIAIQSKYGTVCRRHSSKTTLD